MSNTKETLSHVMADIIANRKNLSDQLNTQKQQLEVGEAQLVKFDQLIATLQVASSSDELVAQIDDQAAVNAAAGTNAAPSLPAAANS